MKKDYSSSDSIVNSYASKGGNKRRKNYTVEKPIIIGSISFFNPKKNYEG